MRVSPAVIVQLFRLPKLEGPASMEGGCVTALVSCTTPHNTCTTTRDTLIHDTQHPAQHEDCVSMILNLIL